MTWRESAKRRTKGFFMQVNHAIDRVIKADTVADKAIQYVGKRTPKRLLL